MQQDMAINSTQSQTFAKQFSQIRLPVFTFGYLAFTDVTLALDLGRITDSDGHQTVT